MTKPITSGGTQRTRAAGAGQRAETRRAAQDKKVADAFVTGKDPAIDPTPRRPSGVTSPPAGRLEGTPASGPTDALEGPRADLAALVDGSTGVAATKRTWVQLYESEHAAAGTLGFDARSWDRARAGDEGALPSQMSTRFAALPKGAREAASLLGFTEVSWDQDLAGRQALAADPAVYAAWQGLVARGGPITEGDVQKQLGGASKQALTHLLEAHGHLFSDTARRAARDLVLDGNAKVARDGSGLTATQISQVARATSHEDVAQAIGAALEGGKKLAPAGRKDGMGGQSAVKDGIQLDLTGMNRVSVSKDGQSVTAESGATWAQVIAQLAPHGRTLKVVQSNDAFTTGGSLSVNAHSNAAGEGPLASQVRSFRIMTPDRQIHTATRTQNRELFRHALGGLGLMGVILDAELKTVPDRKARLEVTLVSKRDYPKKLAAALRDPAVEVAYGRIDPRLGGQIALHVVKRDTSAGSMERRDPPRIAAVRAVHELSQEATRGSPSFLEARRWAEAKLSGGEAKGTRSRFLSPNLESLRHNWFNEAQRTDVIHEYFVPKPAFNLFLAGLEAATRAHGVDALDCTIRDVAADEDTALSYARKDSFAFAVTTNVTLDAHGAERVSRLGRALVDLALDAGGTFYLAGPRHYTAEQLHRAYPGVDAFFAFKRTVDPNEVLSNGFYEAFGKKPGITA